MSLRDLAKFDVDNWARYFFHDRMSLQNRVKFNVDNWTKDILLNVNVLDVFLNEAYDLQWIIMNHLIIVLLKL